MKKALIVLLLLMMVTGTLAGCKSTSTSPDTTTGKFHIGIVTNTVTQAEDAYRGGEALADEYGKAADGGIIEAITIPDNFQAEQETTISSIVGLADDPLMKAIIICDAVPGTAEAFKQVRAKRSDILLFAGKPMEDPNVIAPVCDVAANYDQLTNAYINVWAAKQMGAKSLVFISFPRHMSLELISRAWAITQAAGKDLGIATFYESASDPLSDVGVPGAQQYILEHVPAWVQKYGTDTAFYTTNLALQEPLLKQIMKYGGMSVGILSPTLGYPGAFGIDLSAEKGNWPAILKKVEETVVAQGGSGRFNAWAFSMDYVTVAGLGEYAKRCIEGTAKVGNQDDMLAAFGKYSPGAAWNCSAYRDVGTGNEVANYFQLYQDTYVFGKGFMGATKEKMPEKYLTVK
ncbi:MAG: DUF3798 domain-containing protein [Candidatus Cryosericum sp.]